MKHAISPLVEVVRDGLKQEILEVAPDACYVLPTERQIGQRFGVSRTIVRGALQQLVEEGLMVTRPNCRPVVKVPTTHRRPTGNSCHVGVWLWPFNDDHIVSSMMRGIQRQIPDARHRLIVGTSKSLRWADVIAAEKEFLHSLIDDPEAVGAIVWLLGDEASLPALRRARASGLDFVFVDRLPPAEFEADFVGTDNFSSARAAVSHLVELGHERIVCIRNSDTASTVDDRVRGYRRALEDAHLTAQVVQVEGSGFGNEADHYRRLVASLFEQPMPPTAIFAINDQMGRLVYETLDEFGVPVPDQMSIVGFDGIYRRSPGGVSLSSAYQDFYRIGEIATEQLLSRTRGDARPSTYRHVLLDAPLKTQSTTAAPRKGHAPGRPARSLPEIPI